MINFTGVFTVIVDYFIIFAKSKFNIMAQFYQKDVEEDLINGNFPTRLRNIPIYIIEDDMEDTKDDCVEENSYEN